MPTPLQKPIGFVLLINLIVLLLLAIIITTMYHTTLLQQQMTLQFNVQQVAKHRANSSLLIARQSIKAMLKSNQDLSNPYQGFYPKSTTVKVDSFDWRNVAKSFNSKHGRYIIHHLGKAPILSGNKLGKEHHLFFIYSMSESQKGGRYIQHEFLSIDPASL